MMANILFSFKRIFQALIGLEKYSLAQQKQAIMYIYMHTHAHASYISI